MFCCSFGELEIYQSDGVKKTSGENPPTFCFSQSCNGNLDFIPQDFIVPLLTLAFAYGELHQLLLLYSQPYGEQNPLKPDETKDENVWNLTYFHSYASREDWEKLAESTAETHIHLWAPLILQKIRYLVLFAGCQKRDNGVKKLVGFLVDHYSGCETLWLNNFKYLLPFMSAKHLKMMGQRMVDCQSWHGMMPDQDLVDRRSFQMAITGAVFQSILDRGRKRKADEDEPFLLKTATQSVLKILCQQLDVWIGSVDRADKDVTTWLRQAAESIRATMRSAPHELGPGARSAGQLEDHLRPLDLIEKLPLEYATGTFHAAVLMGLLSLLFSFEECDVAGKDRVWMMIVRLLDNPEKLSSLYSYVPSEEFLKWAVPSTRDLEHSSVIFASVFDEVLRSPEGQKDVTKWVESTNFDAQFDILVVAMEKLGRHYQSATNDDKKALWLQMFDALRAKFLAHFEASVTVCVTYVLRGAISLLHMYLEHMSKKVITGWRDI